MMDLRRISNFVGFINVDAEKEFNIKILETDGNWVKGKIGDRVFNAKVFTVPSEFGLYNGRISKLEIQKPNAKYWGVDDVDYHFDRGFDHATGDGIKLSRQLLKVFPKNAEKIKDG